MTSNDVLGEVILCLGAIGIALIGIRIWIYFQDRKKDSFNKRPSQTGVKHE